MHFLVRNKYWLIFLWLIIILLLYKIINNFEFTEFESFICIGVLISFPLFLTITTIVIRQKNLKKLKTSKLDMICKIDETIEKEFLSYFKQQNKDTPIYHYDKEKHIVYFINKNKEEKVTVTFNNNYAEIGIISTFVCFRFYYGKTIEVMTKYDEWGFEKRSIENLYKRITNKINLLINHHYTYNEYIKNGRIIASSLNDNNEIIYINCKNASKLPSSKYLESRIIEL